MRQRKRDNPSTHNILTIISIWPSISLKMHPVMLVNGVSTVVHISSMCLQVLHHIGPLFSYPERGTPVNTAETISSIKNHGRRPWLIFCERVELSPKIANTLNCGSPIYWKGARKPIVNDIDRKVVSYYESTLNQLEGYKLLE